MHPSSKVSCRRASVCLDCCTLPNGSVLVYRLLRSGAGPPSSQPWRPRRRCQPPALAMSPLARFTWQASCGEDQTGEE
eukprot:731584-Rhodomonas_salina.1